MRGLDLPGCHPSPSHLLAQSCGTPVSNALQVGDAKVDHGNWARPEEMTYERPVFSLDANHSGSLIPAFRTSSCQTRCSKQCGSPANSRYSMRNARCKGLADAMLDEALVSLLHGISLVAEAAAAQEAQSIMWQMRSVTAVAHVCMPTWPPG